MNNGDGTSTIGLADGGTITVDNDGVDNVDDADSSVTNEVNTAFNVASGNLNITDSNGTLTVPLSSIDTDTDDQTLNITGDQLSISEGNTVTIPTADGTETIVTAGTDISVTGDGSSATPYVINNVRPDIFYPPSIAVDVSTTGTGRTIDLHNEYLSQYGTPSVVSLGAPAAIPTYANNELYYYVTYFDPAVFANVSINPTGTMTYDVIATPTDYNTLINVVFVAQ